MALAKQKYGASVWRGMSAQEKAAAIDAQQQGFKARRSPARRSPGRTAPVRVRSPAAVQPRSPPRSGGAAVAGSLSDMNALLGTLQATNTLGDGQAAQLAALQEAVVSSMLVVEKEMDKLSGKTQEQLERFSVEKAKLIAEKDHAVAAQLAAEEEVRTLRRRLSARDGESSQENESRVQVEQALAALSHAQSNEKQLQQQVALVRQEVEDAKGQSASLRVQLEAEHEVAQQLRQEVEAVKRENEAMRLKFAARLDDLARGQEELRDQQDSLTKEG